MRAKLLAQQITGRADQRELFEETAAAGEQAVAVRLKGLRLERGRSFGDVWLGWTLWRALRLDELCAELLPAGREAMPWAQMAAVLVIARLCEPSSELHIAEDWYRKTALEDLLGLPGERINDDRLYRSSGSAACRTRKAIEKHLKKRLGELFALEYDLLLYDVTSTYFEGLAEQNTLAPRGYCRDHRPDCKQVCIALVVTREGMPLGYEVFAGNRTDVTTVEEIVETMEARYGLANRIWVMDRGMISEENVALLQETERRYLIGTPKSVLRKRARRDRRGEGLEDGPRRSGSEAVPGARWRRDLRALPLGAAARERKGDARALRAADREEPAKARRARRHAPEGLCTGAARAADRAAARAQHPRRRTLHDRLRRGYDTAVGTSPGVGGEARVGRVGGTARAATCCAPTSPTGTPRRCGEPTSSSPRPRPPSASRRATWRSARSGIRRPSACRRTSWSASSPTCCGRRLSSGRAAPDWATARGRSSRSSRRIQSTDVVLPLAEDPSRKLRIRCVVRPDKAQAMLLDRLGLRLPERLRVPPKISEM